MYGEKERLEELRNVRHEASGLKREEGARIRPAITMMALIMVVWLVLLLFDLVNGRSITASTALVLAAFTGLCWGAYREKRERSFALYAGVASAALLAVVVAHVSGF